MGKYRICLAAIATLLVAFSFAGLTVPVAHADGGAPNLAYVSGARGGIGVVDVQQQKVTSTISLGGDPHAVALSLDGRFLYVAQPALHRMSIVAAKTGTVVCHVDLPGSPSLLALDAYNKILYVAANDSSTVTSIDPEQCTIKQRITTAGPVYGIALASLSNADTSTTDQLWVSNPNAVSVFNVNNGKSLGSASIPEGPRYLLIPPGGTVYATTAKGQVDAISLNSHVVSQLLTGGTYGPMDFNETTGEVYVPDSKNKELAVLNPVNAGFAIPKEPSRVLKLDVAPVSIAITSDGQLGFAALQNGSVEMYDIPGQQEITRIQTGGTPRFIITGLYPPALGTTPQQASQITNIATIAGYGLVVILLIVPFLLFMRFSRNRKHLEAQGLADQETQQAEGRDTSDDTQQAKH